MTIWWSLFLQSSISRLCCDLLDCGQRSWPWCFVESRVEDVITYYSLVVTCCEVHFGPFQKINLNGVSLLFLNPSSVCKCHIMVEIVICWINRYSVKRSATNNCNKICCRHSRWVIYSWWTIWMSLETLMFYCLSVRICQCCRILFLFQIWNGNFDSLSEMLNVSEEHFIDCLHY